MHQALPIRFTSVKIPGGAYEQQRETIRQIGKAIKAGSIYLPIRNHAASLATTAGPKNYLGQVKAIYDGMIKNWRYVRDPVSRELVTHSPHAIYQLILAGDGRGVGRGKGAGDCDDAAAAVGAQLEAIGFPTRIAVTAPRGAPAGRMFGHVFVQAQVPGHGWVTVDPVVHPDHGFGWTPHHSRFAVFNLAGKLISARGNVVGLSGLSGPQNINKEVVEMYNEQIPDLGSRVDYGLSGLDGYTDEEPDDWATYGMIDYGAYAEQLGIMDGVGLGLNAEVDFEPGPDGHMYARTPMLEIAPDDLEYMQHNRYPYEGMLALGDTGQVYQWELDGDLGFFKKLFKKAKRRLKRRVKKMARGLKRRAIRLIKRLPGGKYLIKLHRKLWKISMKLVRPLMKYVGKYASKLAPVAALIPGYGPAIAGALYTAGKVANLMRKYDVKIFGKKGKVRKLDFKSGKQAKAFKRALRVAASKVKRRGSRRRRSRPSRRSTSRARRMARFVRSRRRGY